MERKELDDDAEKKNCFGLITHSLNEYSHNTEMKIELNSLAGGDFLE